MLFLHAQSSQRGEENCKRATARNRACMGACEVDGKDMALAAAMESSSKCKGLRGHV